MLNLVEMHRIDTRKFELRKVGEIGVDAGLCWIGDPCYILHAEEKPKAVGQDWSQFCAKLHGREGDPVIDPLVRTSAEDATQFNYDMGHAGLGVCVGTGYGDGTYPVYVLWDKEEKRCAGIIVDFYGFQEADPDFEEDPDCRGQDDDEQEGES